MKTGIKLMLCSAIALGIMGALYMISDKEQELQDDLNRNYAFKLAPSSTEKDIEFNSYFVAGTSSDHIYLWNLTSHLRLLELSKDFSTTRTIDISIDTAWMRNLTTAVTVSVHGPHFYLNDGSKRLIVRGSVTDWKAKEMIKSPAYFTQIIPVTTSSFAIRTNVPGKDSVSANENTLGLISDSVELKPNLLQKQVDGFFCTDGKLLFSPSSGKVVYTYFYRNSFLVCDTSMNLLYRGNTIDSFKTARLRVMRAGNVTNITYRKYINTATAASESRLFVCSAIKSSRRIDSSENQTDVDVYSLQTGGYQFSFLLPDFHDKGRLKEIFALNDTSVVVLYDKYIARYDLVHR